MKYILIYESKTDQHEREFDDLNKALQTGDLDFEYMSDYGIKHCDGFYLLESINPDETAENHFDGNIIKKWM